MPKGDLMESSSVTGGPDNMRGVGHDLWMVQAVFQPFRTDAVLLALEEMPGVSGLTIVDCRGLGGSKMLGTDQREPRTSTSDGGDDSEVVDFTNKTLVETVVAGRERADLVISAILRSAHTGRRGDGKIFAWPLSRAVSIRTGEEQANAL